MDSALVTFILNAGTAGGVIVLIVLGLLVPKPTVAALVEENAKLKDALALERQRSNDAAAAGTVTNQLIGALTSMATDHRADVKQDRDERTASRNAPLDLTGEDLGLT